MNLVKRFFVFALMLTTVFSMSAFTFNVNAAGNYPAGSLLALEGVDGAAVYYIGSDGMKYVFPDPKTYATWYPNFDNVVRVSVSELDMYADGGAVTYRPGTKLITHENTAKVYAVTPGGEYCHIPSEEVAIAIYGEDWGSMVQDVIPGFFSSSYSDGACELSDMLPDGTVVMMGETYYYIENGMKRPFASADAFEANNFSYDFVLEVDDLSDYSDGESITGEEEALAGFMPGEGSEVTPAPVYGDLGIALASNTPSSGNVVTGVDNIPFAKFNFTAGSGDVKVTSVKVGRKGLGSTSDFTSVTLYEGSTKLGTTRSSWASDNTINFNIPGGWDIDSGETRELTVVGNLASANTYNALGIVDVTLAEGDFDGSLPMYGNEMVGVSVTVGGVTITNQGSNATKKIGTTDVTLAEFRLAVDNVENSHFESITLKNKANTSNASDNDVANVKLYYGSTLLAGPVEMNSDKVVLTLEEPFEIEKNKNEDFKVVGDIMNGDGHTVEFVLDATTDLTVKGQTYGTPLTVTSGNYNEYSEGMIVTIDGAELNVAFSSEPLDTMDDVDNVVFGTLTLGAGSTDIKITNMIFTIDETDGNSTSSDNLDVDEFELVASDNTAYSGAMTGGGDTNANDETWTFDEEIYLVANNSETFTLRGDLPTGIGDGDSYKVTMTVNATNMTAETVPEGDAVDNYSISSLNGKLVTVKAPYLTVKVDAQNTDSVVVNSEDVSLFKGTVKAVAGDVKVTRMKFEGSETTSTVADDTFLDEDNFDGLTLWIDGEVAQNVSASNISSGIVDFDSFEYTFEDGVLTSYEVTADIASTLDSTNTSVHLQLDTVTAKDANNDTASAKDASGTAIANGAELSTSRSLTLTDKGILYLSLRAADVGYNKSRVALAGNDYWVAKLRVRAEYEDVKIEDLKLTNAAGSTSDDSVDQVCLYNEPTASADYLVGCTDLSSGVAFYEDLNYVVELGTEDWYVYVQTNEMGNGAAQTADTADYVQLSVASTTSGYVVARGNESNELLTVGNANGTPAAGEIVFDFDLDNNFDDAVDTATYVSPTFTVAGSKYATVELVPAGTSIGGEVVADTISGTGEYTLAILAVTAEANDNTDRNGNPLISYIDGFLFDVTKYATTTLSGATIERIGGSQGAQALTVTSQTTSTGSTSDDWTYTSASSTMATDAKIEAGQTAYFVVKGTIDNLDSTTGVVDWVRVSLDDLNGTNTSVNNIDWYDGRAYTNAFEYLRFDTGSITGVKVDENL